MMRRDVQRCLDAPCGSALAGVITRGMSMHDALWHVACAVLLLGATGCDARAAPSANGTQPLSAFVAVTFNAGTPDCSRSPDAAYSCDDAAIAADWYGTGLAFKLLVDEARSFFSGLQPDVVAFQEIFYSGDCPDIPTRFHPGFVCEDWQPGAPTVVQLVLGPDYQIACNIGKPDKCLAVKKTFGRWRGCASELCLDHLAGARVTGCGSGSRIGRGVIDLVGGDEITIINVHGTAGITNADQDCRVRQFEQVFADLGDGSAAPAANGMRNLVLGDLNVDPARMFWDASATTWNRYVGDGLPFHFLTEVGFTAEPTYAGLFNIDHVASDAFTGTCTSDEPTDIVAFDHLPIVCNLSLPSLGSGSWGPRT